MVNEQLQPIGRAEGGEKRFAAGAPTRYGGGGLIARYAKDVDTRAVLASVKQRERARRDRATAYDDEPRSRVHLQNVLKPDDEDVYAPIKKEEPAAAAEGDATEAAEGEEAAADEDAEVEAVGESADAEEPQQAAKKGQGAADVEAGMLSLLRSASHAAFILIA